MEGAEFGSAGCLVVRAQFVRRKRVGHCQHAERGCSDGNDEREHGTIKRDAIRRLERHDGERDGDGIFAIGHECAGSR